MMIEEGENEPEVEKMERRSCAVGAARVGLFARSGAAAEGIRGRNKSSGEIGDGTTTLPVASTCVRKKKTTCGRPPEFDDVSETTHNV